jgi:hypothetical protein
VKQRFLRFFCFLLLCRGTALQAEYLFSADEWSFAVQFAAEPQHDIILTPSPEGEVKATRYFHEKAGEHYLLIRFVYPLALPPGSETGLYDKSRQELMRSRPGQVRTHEKYQLGPYEGERVVIAQPRERSLRELRLVVIGSSLYVLSAEWPAQSDGATRAAAFFASVRLRPDCEEPRLVEDRERWREFAFGNFKVKYDALRWYRDPADQEPGIFNFLRVDKLAEAQFIAEEHPVEGGDIEKAVLATALEGATSVRVQKRGKKLRGTAQVVDLEFAATVENATYINHGYFYSGAEGTVQLRGWAKDRDYRDASGDIGELLDGLVIGPKGGTLLSGR